MRDNESDAAIIGIKNQQQARESQLLPVAHEITDDRYFIAMDKSVKDDAQLLKLPM